MKAHAVPFLVAAIASAAIAACTTASPTSTAGPVITTPPPVASVQASAVPAPSPSPVVITPTAIVSATAAATANPTPQQTASPGGVPGQTSSGTLDPCALLSSAEASAVNGVSYGAGTAHTLTPVASECVWQAAGASVVLQLAVAATPDQAQTAYAEALAAQADFDVVDVPNVGDKAAIVRAKKLVSTGGIYVLDGSVGFDVVYLNGTAPTDAQLVANAELILGRLP